MNLNNTGAIYIKKHLLYNSNLFGMPYAMKKEKYLLNAYQIKIFALLCMLIDHVGLFFLEDVVFLRYIGRLSAPLFLFCLVWGLDYTHNRTKYLMRLYIFSLIMEAVWAVLGIWIKGQSLQHNNIFSTFFIIAMIVSILSSHDEKETMLKKILKICVWQLCSLFLCFITDLYPIARFVQAATGSVFFNEGGVTWCILGVLLYYIKNNKKTLIIGYTGYCIIYELMAATAILARILYFITYHASEIPWFTRLCEMIYKLFTQENYFQTPMELHGLYWGNYQWIMIFALPIMLLYNHKKGTGNKWFFYLLYPIHIVIFAIIQNILFV